MVFFIDQVRPGEYVIKICPDKEPSYRKTFYATSEQDAYRQGNQFVNEKAAKVAS